MGNNKSVGVSMNNELVMGAGTAVGRRLSNRFVVECFDSEGRSKWAETFDNLVVNVGLDDSLDKHLKGSSYTAAWYVGLTAGSPTFAAGDTMSSHSGWTEFTTYSEGARQTLSLGAVSGQSVDNSASPATFNISGSGTVGGAFIVNNSTKGGTSGTLYGGGAFTSGNRVVINGDVIRVTVTCTASAS